MTNGTVSDQETLLVTGAGGLLGSHLLRLLVERHAAGRLLALVRRRNPERLPATAGVELLRGDLRDPQTWRAVPPEITGIFHLAAAVASGAQTGSAAALVEENLLPLGQLLEHSKSWPKLRQVVYASSVSVYGEADRADAQTLAAPSSAYAAAKLAGECLLGTLRARGVKVSCLRFVSLYGPGMSPQTVIPIMLKRARERREICVYGTGARRQDFLHAADAARACLAAWNSGADGNCNVGAGRGVSMLELATAIAAQLGNVTVRQLPELPEGKSGCIVDPADAARALQFRAELPLAQGLADLTAGVTT